MGFVSSTGHIQIARKNYFNPKFSSIEDNLILKDCEILKIKNEINKYSEFKSSNLIVNFEGLIGNPFVSKPFFATAFKNPDFVIKSLSLVAGNPLFDSSVGDFLIGSSLAISLGIENLTKENSKLTLMTDTLGEGLILQDIRLSGIIKFPVIQTDSMVAIASINTLKSFFDFEEMVRM